MRAKQLLGVLAFLVSVALIGFAAGCGDDDDEDSAATTPETTAADTGGGGGVTVEMTEYEFSPNELVVAAGDTVTLENTGQVPHNLTIVEGTDPEAGGAELAASDDLAGGDSGELTVDVEPGDYSFLCTIPGHAEDGMVGTITIEE